MMMADTSVGSSGRSVGPGGRAPARGARSLASRGSGALGKARQARDRLAHGATRTLLLPLHAAAKWWEKRNALPPTKNGRHIPVALRTPAQIDERSGKPYCNNVISSANYSVYDFLPRQIIYQFSKLANIYFLFVSILQMIPSWSTTGNYTTIVPLMIFVTISITREGYDDWRRHKVDRIENNRTTLVAGPAGAASREKPRGTWWKKELAADLYPMDDVSSYHTTSAGSAGAPDLHGPASGAPGAPLAHPTDPLALPQTAPPDPISYTPTKWKDIKVGQIVRVLQNEWVPADIVLLHTSGFKGQTYVETMALDGETNLKMKELHPEIQDAFCIDSLPSLSDSFCITEDPNLDLYNFDGSLVVGGKRYPLGPQNVVYRGSILRNTASCFGLVIFTGTETKIQQNALKSFRSKSPKLQSKVNWIVVMMAIFVILLSLFGTIASNRMQSQREGRYWYIEGLDVTFVQNFMGFIIMFNTLIPLSLYVSLEICKLLQKMLMESDINMYDPASDTPFKCQTVSLNEELGQVGYIFSDKTGTLTENVMLFRKMTVGGYAWLHDLDLVEADPDATRVDDKEKREYLFHKAGTTGTAGAGIDPNVLLYQVQSLPQARPSLGGLSMGRPSLSGPRASIGRPSLGAPGTRPSQTHPRPSQTHSQTQPWTSTANPIKPQDAPSTLQMLEYIMRNPASAFSQRAKFFLLSLALCHSASPEVDLSEVGAEGEVEIEYLDYQAASPDELALVSAARDLGFLVVDRQFDGITLRTYPRGFEHPPVDEFYAVLDTIEFTSHRKRMSIVVRMPDGRICLLTKGADNVMIERLHSDILDAARQKRLDLDQEGTLRRSIEAEVVQQRRSSESGLLGRGRPSLNIDRTAALMAIDQHLHQRNEELIIQESSRRSVEGRGARGERASVDRAGRSERGEKERSRSRERGTSHERPTRASMERFRAPSAPAGGQGTPQGPPVPPPPADPLGNPTARFIIEQTLTHVDEFSTEGLRTLMYGHRFLSASEYSAWKLEYDEARATQTGRAARIAEVGEKLERNYELTGATAIEDKLQHGVPETIEKLRRANIKMWMLTGDKRETAINIGYSCRLIKDYSTVVILRLEEDLYATIFAALEEIQEVAHCVVVIDGHTLAAVESDPALMSLFVDLSLKADSIIVCRASPAQKATMVKQVRARIPDQVTLAIGDGANDIAMIKAADLGIGIAGREGLQAARSSDYSLGQFRFLLNLLLVHGRWNYVRTCKYILATFYKEFLFYMAQVVFQRWTLFTGTSLYESWSISMFNTLFTSLPVIALGAVDKDLDAATLIAVPELYAIGQRNQAFSTTLFLSWLLMAMTQCVGTVFMAVQGWGKDPAILLGDLYPLGVVVYSCVVTTINVKLLFLEMRLVDILTVAAALISVGGYQLWNLLIGAVFASKPTKTYYVVNAFRDQFGREACYWACVVLITAMCLVFDVIVRHVQRTADPTESQVFEVLERDPQIARRLEQESAMELEPGWHALAKMPTSWSALLRGQWPARARSTHKPQQHSRPPRRMDVWLGKLRNGRSSSHYDRDIDAILEQRERELNASAV